MKISAVFEAIDKITAPVKKIGAALGGMKKSVKGVGDESKKTAGETGLLGRVAEKTGGIFGNLKGRIGNAASALEKYHQTAGRARGSSGLLKTAMQGLTVYFSAKTFGDFIGGIIGINAKFEQFQATLETIYDGGSGRAKASLGWIQKFAKDTPYELDQVTDAFVKLSSYGIDPQARALRTLGDAASGMNKSLDQGVEALADARTFEFERLKEFGITSQQQADKVRFTYTKAGKATTIVVKKTANDVQKAILDIFDARFVGGMARQSKTLAGVWSNLQDFWTGFQKKIGEKGVFDKVKARLGGFLDWLNDPKNQGQIDVWATKISDALVKLYDALFDLAGSIDWIALIDGLAGFVSWLGKLIDKVGGLKNLIDLGIAAWIASLVFGLNALTPVIVAVAGAFLGLEVAAWPITLIIGLIALLAAGAFLVWRNWDKVKTWFAGFWDWLTKNWQFMPVIGPMIHAADLLIKNWDKVQEFFKGLGDTITGVFDGVMKGWDALPDWLRIGVAAVVPGGAALAPALAGPKFAPPLQGNAGGRGQSFNGQIDLRIKSDAPVTVDRNTTSTDSFSTNILHGRQGGF